MDAVSSHVRGATTSIQVHPRAPRTEVVSEHDGWLKVRVAAPPVDGVANTELVNWLSKQLKIPKADIEFLSGERGRRKVALIHGLSVTGIRQALDLT
ncbi:DUF167 family protein YggU [soil metagenome]